MRRQKYQPNDKLQRAAAKLLGIAPEYTCMAMHEHSVLVSANVIGRRSAQ